jgi:hypothetical protein
MKNPILCGTLGILFVALTSCLLYGDCNDVIDGPDIWCCDHTYQQQTSQCIGIGCAWCQTAHGECCGQQYTEASLCTTNFCRAQCDGSDCGEAVRRIALLATNSKDLDPSTVLVPSCSGGLVALSEEDLLKPLVQRLGSAPYHRGSRPGSANEKLLKDQIEPSSR